MADLEAQLIAEKQKKLEEAVEGAGEGGVPQSVVSEMQALIDQLTNELEKKTIVVSDLQDDKQRIQKEKAEKLAEVAKEFEKLQK